jgi:sulfoxide reductase heme-binding subunit YedZ
MARVLARVPLWLGLGALALAGALAMGETWPFARALVLVRVVGGGAAIALACALCVTPAAKLVRFFGFSWSAGDEVRLRRGFGICAAALSLVHAGLALKPLLLAQLSLVFSLPRLRAGLCALVILLLLWLTSYARVLRLLRIRLWNELHVLAYPAAVLVVLHALLSPFGSRALVLTIAVGVLTIGLFRALPRR